jgi:ribosomal protein S18 acetylase RimI-like enzyme
LTDSPNDQLVDVVWHALNTEHAGLAISAPLARRYPADVVPFAALQEHQADALAELRELMFDGEETYVAWSLIEGKAFPECPGVEVVLGLNALQMAPARPVSNNATAPDRATPLIERLGAVNGPEMVALTDLAFPGFFRTRTYLMGGYWGIRVDGELIAMAGERMAIPGFREISAVCTHPEHTRRGYATRLIRHVMNEHAAAGLKSFLHVAETNQRAIALYERLGYVKVGVTRCTRIRRIPIPIE